MNLSYQEITQIIYGKTGRVINSYTPVSLDKVELLAINNTSLLDEIYYGDLTGIVTEGEIHLSSTSGETTETPFKWKSSDEDSDKVRTSSLNIEGVTFMHVITLDTPNAQVRFLGYKFNLGESA